jgi:osmotically-inducible protein OsmY
VSQYTIEVGVHEGVVTLRGMVDSQRRSDLATETAEGVAGVRKVQNQLEVEL